MGKCERKKTELEDKNCINWIKEENTQQEIEEYEFMVAGKKEESKFRCDVEKKKHIYQRRQISA